MSLAVVENETAQGLLSVLAFNMKDVSQHMGPWSVGALTYGLSILYEKHVKDEVSDIIQGEEVCDRKELHKILRDVKLAYSAYNTDASEVWTQCAELHVEVVKESLKPEAYCPAYFIAIDHEHKSVLLVIRGTSSVNDLFADLSGSFEDHDCGGKSHYGITLSAKALLEKTKSALVENLNKCEGYHLKIIGHSLGGGAGSLLCYMINHDPILLSELGGMNAECFGIATPPVLSKDIAYQCEDHTTTLVMENDIIARASLVNLERLREEISTCGWEDRLKEMTESRDFRLKLGFGASLLLGGPFRLALVAVAASELLPNDFKKNVSTSVQKFVEDNNVEDKLRTAGMKAGELGDFLTGKAKKAFSAAERTAKEIMVKTTNSIKRKPLSSPNDTTGDTASTLQLSSQPAEQAPRSAQDSSGSEIGPVASSLPAKDCHEAKKDCDKGSKEISNAEPTQLYCPGRIIHIKRTKGEDGAESFSVTKGHPHQRLERIVLAKTMFADHLLSTYQQALEKHLVSTDESSRL